MKTNKKVKSKISIMNKTVFEHNNKIYVIAKQYF